MIRVILRLLLLSLAIAAGPGAARAQSCSFSMTDINFGLMDPPATSSSQPAAGTFSATCTGTPSHTVHACAKLLSGSGGDEGDYRRFDGASSSIAFKVSAESIGYADLWGDGYNSAKGSPLYLEVMLNESGNGNASQTTPAELSVASSVTPGTYVSTFTAADLQISYGYTTPADCIENLGTNTTASFQVMAGINETCLVSASDLNFGEVSSLASDVIGTSAVSVTCTTGLDYAVSLNGGLYGTIAARKMKIAGGTDTVDYNLYTNATRSTLWGDSTAGSVQAGDGTGAAQALTVYGKVDAQASTPAAGTYTDTITVTVTY